MLHTAYKGYSAAVQIYLDPQTGEEHTLKYENGNRVGFIRTSGYSTAKKLFITAVLSLPTDPGV